jgi:D-alanyl-D-alanine carboxypeptidase/D-alanyl-D-alanine-endopeptidase (penicillin-binding protein 4)
MVALFRFRLILPLLAVPALSPAAVGQEATLSTRLDAALAKFGPHASVGCRVLALPGGEVLYERTPDLSLTPASNMKLLTSSTALAVLGPDYTYITRVFASAPVKDGAVRGDLILQGGGDPVLERAHLNELAAAVKRTGVKKITGDLIVDDQRYVPERLGDGWAWDDESYYYQAQISALSVDRNVATLDILPAKKPGDPAEVQIHPLADWFTLLQRPTTGAAGSGRSVDWVRERARNALRVTGSIAVDAEPLMGRQVTMEEPQRFAGALFRLELGHAGVKVKGEVTEGAVPSSAVMLAERKSPPLREIVKLFNKPSDNLVGELLLREIGLKAKGKGDAASGGEAVRSRLESLGLDVGGLRVNDGSGLGRRNLVTARLISEMLRASEREPWADIWRESLPVSARDGTLRSRMKGTAAEGRISAKTGTLGGVSALSGFVTTVEGRRLVFSLIENNFPASLAAKAIEDEAAEMLATWKAPQP